MASRKKSTKKQAAAEAETQEVEAPEAATAAPKQPSQNGVTRPREGTKTGRVWEIADELSAAAGEPIARGDVMKVGEAEGLNESTIATQYGRWRKFHGLKGQRKAKVENEEPAAEVEEEEED